MSPQQAVECPCPQLPVSCCCSNSASQTTTNLLSSCVFLEFTYLESSDLFSPWSLLPTRFLCVFELARRASVWQLVSVRASVWQPMLPWPTVGCFSFTYDGWYSVQFLSLTGEVPLNIPLSASS